MLLHRTVGACLFHAGAHEHARRHYERILEVRGDDFGAYVRLALVAYRLGDYASWQRECGHARRTDPLRYARLKHPFELFDGRAAGAEGPSGPAMSPWRRAIRVSRVGAHDQLDDAALAPSERTTGAPAPESRPAGDDFTSDAERARFRSLEPIDADAIRATDLDELMRRLGA